MAHFVPRTTRILDLLMVAVLLMLVLAVVWETFRGYGHPVVLSLCCLVLAGLWLWRRRHPEARWVSLALFGLGLVVLFAGDGPPTLPLLFFILLMLVLDFGPWAGVGAALLHALLGGVVAGVLLGTPWPGAVLDGVAGFLFLMVAFLFALMLREANQQTLAKQRALEERDTSNRALREANQRLRDSVELEKELLLAEERARSARELHDGLGHRLAVARMSLEFAERMHTRNPERSLAELRTAREGIETTIDEMRVWVRALHPARGDGDADGFQAVADSFQSTGMEVGFVGTGEEFPLTDVATLYCYRFVQEGLTNVLRHAKGDRVQIRVAYAWPALRIAVTNTGSAPGEITEGFGLRSLRERAEQLGGSFTARPRADGFQISAELPQAAELDAVDRAAADRDEAAPGDGVLRLDDLAPIP